MKRPNRTRLVAGVAVSSLLAIVASTRVGHGAPETELTANAEKVPPAAWADADPFPPNPNGVRQGPACPAGMPPGISFQGMGPPKPPRGPEGGLAAALSALETEIGIRSNQLDAWRDFSDALLAVLKPPKPPVPARPNEPKSDSPSPQNKDSASAPEPLSAILGIASDATARGRKAEDLSKAVERLRTALSDEQLVKLAEAEKRLLPPPFPPSGPRGDQHPGGNWKHPGRQPPPPSPR